MNRKLYILINKRIHILIIFPTLFALSRYCQLEVMYTLSYFLCNFA